MTPIPFEHRAHLPHVGYHIVVKSLEEGEVVIAEGKVSSTEECNLDTCIEKCGEMHVVVTYIEQDQGQSSEISYVFAKYLTGVQGTYSKTVWFRKESRKIVLEARFVGTPFLFCWFLFSLDSDERFLRWIDF